MEIELPNVTAKSQDTGFITGEWQWADPPYPPSHKDALQRPLHGPGEMCSPATEQCTELERLFVTSDQRCPECRAHGTSMPT